MSRGTTDLVSEGDDEARSRATELWQRAYELQMSSDVDGAISLYEQSLRVCPTAEAHTFLGWVLSWRGDVDAAIDHCKRAIEVDPEFGNPYNDIGVYLLEKGRLEESVPWFEQAKAAPRYEPRHFPFLNLGRVYAALGKVSRAIEELEGALAIAPHDTMARAAIEKLRRLN